MKLNFDISLKEFSIIQTILTKYLSRDTKAWVFGSRANNKAFDYSDLDIALEGNKKIEAITFAKIKSDLEESSLSYTVDIVDMHAIGANFKTIIDKQKIAFPLMKSNTV